MKFDENESCTIKGIKNLIPNISSATASRRLSFLRDVLDKPKPKIITIKEFREYFGV